MYVTAFVLCVCSYGCPSVCMHILYVYIVCMHVCVCVCLYDVCIHVCVCVGVYVYICMYVCPHLDVTLDGVGLQSL